MDWERKLRLKRAGGRWQWQAGARAGGARGTARGCGAAGSSDQAECCALLHEGKEDIDSGVTVTEEREASSGHYHTATEAEHRPTPYEPTQALQEIIRNGRRTPNK